VQLHCVWVEEFGVGAAELRLNMLQPFNSQPEAATTASLPASLTLPVTLETDRLILRRYTDTDASGILDLVAENRDRLLQNFAGMSKDLVKPEDAASFVLEKTEQWDAGKAFCYGIWLKNSKQQLGQLQVKNVAWNVPSAELSYFIGRSKLRQGFASEAISSILRVTFKQLNFNRIFVRILPSNQESILLANKLGFVEEGLHRSEFRCGRGELHDVLYFSLTSADFR